MFSDDDTVILTERIVGIKAAYAFDGNDLFSDKQGQPIVAAVNCGLLDKAMEIGPCTIRGIVVPTGKYTYGQKKPRVFVYGIDEKPDCASRIWTQVITRTDDQIDVDVRAFCGLWVPIHYMGKWGLGKKLVDIFASMPEQVSSVKWHESGGVIVSSVDGQISFRGQSDGEEKEEEKA